MLLLTDKFKELCQNARIYLDTNAFIYGADNSDLSNLYVELSNTYKTIFVTLNSAEYEFTRGARTLEQLIERRDYVRSLASIISVNKLLDNERNDAFSVAMSLTVKSKDSQYTDFLLAVAMHAYRNNIEEQFILSADVRAFPLNLFTVRGIASFDTKNFGIIHMNLYSLDEHKYASLLKKIIK